MINRVNSLLEKYPDNICLLRLQSLCEYCHKAESILNNFHKNGYVIRIKDKSLNMYYTKQSGEFTTQEINDIQNNPVLLDAKVALDYYLTKSPIKLPNNIHEIDVVSYKIIHYARGIIGAIHTFVNNPPDTEYKGKFVSIDYVSNIF